MVSSSAGGVINNATVAIVDGLDVGKTTTTDADGRYRFADLAQTGFSIRVTARGFTDATLPVTLTANQVVDVRLLLPLARLIDIGLSEIQYDRLPGGGFSMSATGLNAGEGCAREVGGVTTIRSAAPPNLTLDFSWSLPASQIVQPGERFQYRIGTITDDQARSVSASTASTTFSGVSVPCPP